MTALWEYFGYVVEQFNNLQPQHTINFTGVKLPGFTNNNDPYLIEPFTYDFDTILQDPTISLFYSFVRVGTTAMVIIGFYFLCADVLSSILYNTRTTINLGGDK